ncbi:hypothetical protein ACPW90_002754 [Providencia rettgeri]|uniref:hypothetical protein n=1 Tax=unclassified Providencia TaxID=2633465 RepID=UPI001BD54C92|nr:MULTISPECIES: hypothetical protein [unclassified Providencia]EJD6378617.1 hypothetical protein [Providencia rettgeri]ELR5116257.1 hypothetical protein [Providencia rettgeri]HBK4773208.1 hypothetical protein [Providencia rettgeri]HEF8781961.1 hypothetical protein [Providencia rettgeri]
MKKYHVQHETLLRHEQHWQGGSTKLALSQGMYHSYIKNSHKLMEANIRFLDTDSVPAAVMHVCLYRLTHGKMLPEPLSIQADVDVSLIVDNRLLNYHPT